MHKKNSADNVSFIDHSNSSKSTGWAGDSSCSDSLIRQIENTSFAPNSIPFSDTDLLQVKENHDSVNKPNVI